MRLNMVSFTKTNIRGIIIVLIILFAALAISMIYPFYNGIHEGLTPAELDPASTIKTALTAYTNAVELNCQGLINSYASIVGLDQTDIASINGIVGNANFTNSAKFQQISALNSTNTSLLTAINTVHGKNFSSLMTLLQTIPKNTSDSIFNSMVEKQISDVNKIINNSDITSPFYTINTYVQNTGAM
jgi:hypothetical protein